MGTPAQEASSQSPQNRGTTLIPMSQRTLAFMSLQSLVKSKLGPHPERLSYVGGKIATDVEDSPFRIIAINEEIGDDVVSGAHAYLVDIENHSIEFYRLKPSGNVGIGINQSN